MMDFINQLARPDASTGQWTKTLRKAVRLTALVVLLIAGTHIANAQLTTADIVGTVTDPTGASIPNANLTLVNLDTQAKRLGVSSSSGDYQFTLLPVGRYTVTVTAKGFKTSTTSPLAIEAGDRARSDIKMVLGGESETVTVEAQTPLLQADNATVSSTVTAKAVQDLPLNGRNFVQLVALVPGANEGLGNGLSSGGRPDDRRTNAAGLSVNGQDESLNNWVVDGIDDNERIIGTIGIKPNIEGIQEITVETNSYAAEAGRTAGGVINIVTKSGTNHFHGSVYEYFRNDVLDARSVFQTAAQGAKPELRQNQYGGSIGGPIFKNKTFFFFDYEGFRQVTGVTYTGTVPTIDEYDDINSLNGGTPQALLSTTNGTQQAYTAGTPINPLMLNYLKLFPAPTCGSGSLAACPTGNGLSGNYTISPNKIQNYNTYDAQVNHTFNENNTLLARYSYNNVSTFTPPQFGTVNGVQISGGEYNYDGQASNIAQQYELGYTHVFTPGLLIDLRAGYTRINNFSAPLNYGKNVDQNVIGFGAEMTSFSPFANALTPITVGPFGNIGDGYYLPLQDLDNTFQYSGTVSWNKGNHNFKFGASLIRRQARNVQSANADGSYTFNPESDTNSDQKTQQDNQLASALLGAFTSQSRNFNIFAPDYRTWEPSVFVQDSWKATPKLTLLLGIRYDVFTPFTEAHNHISNFDFYQALNDTPSSVSSELKIAGVNGVSDTAGIQTSHNNVAPRVGFSFSATPTTVIRGGYGLSYYPGNYTSNADLKNAPFTSVYGPSCQSTIAVTLETAVNGGTLPVTQNPDCATTTGGNNPGTISSTESIPVPVAPTAAQIANLSTISGLGFVAESPNFRSAMIQQFNLQLEQQFGANVFTIGYVGNIGQHLPETVNNVNQALPYNPNAPLGSATNPTNGARPLAAVGLPNVGGVSNMESGGVSNYNALQTSFQRRFTKGLAFDANYTWAKALSDISGFSQEGNQGWSNALPTNIRATEYGVSEDDIQNRFAVSLNYQFQYGKDWHGIRKAVLAGWEANLIDVWQSGKPFSIVNNGGGADFIPGDNPSKPTVSAGFNNRAVPQNSGGPDRPNTIKNPNLAHKTLTEFFDTSAFAPQPLGTIGNTQRNSLFGPHFRHADVSIFKDFPVAGGVNIQFRAEAFNISNTPNFIVANNGSAAQQFGNSGFGQITATDPNYTPRQLQFVLKAQF
jgi:outer membrane receptor protein involved in Fe transport